MEQKKKRTITITSGKGGVGKSSIVSNMAYILGTMNKLTYILDADLSLGNIDIMFGMFPKYNIKDLIEGKKRIGEIVVEGPCGIRVIPATSGVAELSNLSMEERNILFSSFQELPEHDFLFVDTSAGISSNVVYFNAISQDIFIIVTPDPASITDSYAVIKVLHKRTGRKDFNILINMVKDEQEALDIYKNILLVTDRFLDVYLNFFGFIPADAQVNAATRKQKLWVERSPEAPAAKALQKICERLVS
ncbi:MAG: flagellar synthesis regulator FleN [Syntrophus sp. (in: bacteria)]|nr:flagellar synthesis regulator FleN [Syntrophus sp. (in: bacteria)]